MQAANPLPYLPAEITCPDTGATIHSHRVSEVDKRTYSKFRSDYDLNTEKLIGIGAFGVVVGCKSRMDEQIYAIKKISVGSRDASDGFGSYKDLLRESIILASFDHPAVVRYRYHSTWIESTFVGNTGNDPEIITKNPCLYMQQQLCDSTLQQKMEETKLTKEEREYIFSQVAYGLEHIHKHSIMHGDIGKANIFFCKDQPKIGDFGLSRIIGEGDDVINLGSCPPYYTAPDKRVNAKADVFSLGIQLVELLLNITTAQEASHVFTKLKQEEPEFPHYWSNGLLKTLVTNMLKKNTSDRPSSSDIVQDLTEIQKAIHNFDF